MSNLVECPTCGRKLKAPDSLIGKKVQCPGCDKMFVLPEPIVEAEEVPVHSPEEGTYGIKEEAPKPSSREERGPEKERRRPCPMCGEMILASALKCRFCGEVFDETLRRKSRKRGRSSSSEDDTDLSGFEWVVCVLCSGIGCIVGIVYAIQGKPKGAKMIGISLAFSVLWSIVRFAAERGFR